MTAAITLTTDFGLSDSYVAQMKGVILGIDPEAHIVDVTHLVPARDVLTGAFLLEELSRVFPPGTIHIAVVDPGVGSARRIVAAEIGHQCYVAPDNGLLGLLAERVPVRRIVDVSDARYWRAAVSSTFHGRDIMAPVAAHWSRGVDVTSFGQVSGEPLVQTPFPSAVRHADGIVGEVVYSDHYGNLVTNIIAEMLSTTEPMTVEINDRAIAGLQRFYGQSACGELLALIGSSGRLEVAVNGGSAAAVLQAGRGTRVAVQLEERSGPSASAPAE